MYSSIANRIEVLDNDDYFSLLSHFSYFTVHLKRCWSIHNWEVNWRYHGWFSSHSWNLYTSKRQSIWEQPTIHDESSLQLLVHPKPMGIFVIFDLSPYPIHSSPHSITILSLKSFLSRSSTSHFRVWRLVLLLLSHKHKWSLCLSNHSSLYTITTRNSLSVKRGEEWERQIQKSRV